MRRLPTLGLMILSLTIFLSAGVGRAADGDDGWIRLFDGKSLAGWEGNLEQFRVVDGAIVAGSLSKEIPRNEFLCTKETFGDFELRVEVTLEGEGDNAGIQFRSERIPNHHEVKGYQCDMGSAFGRKIWGALYDESRRRRILAEPDQDELLAKLRNDAWNEFTIRCEGPRVRIWLNGLQTVDYTETEEVARSGLIGLQIHGGKPAVARYRNLLLKRL